MSRDVLDATGIGIASATYDIVGLPPIRLHGPDEGKPAWPRATEFTS